MFKAMICGAAMLALVTGASGTACAEGRYALVIGNSNYEAVTALKNPARDAEAVTKLLSDAGFEVDVGLDVGQSDLRRAVNDFATRIAAKGEDSVVLVYFAGHGMQVDGQNYVLPVDVKLKHQSDVALEAVRLADVMDVLNTIPSKTRIVILDACRNNPFKDLATGSERGLTRVTEDKDGDSIARGLAIVNAPAGTLVAYATSPGATAADGKGGNSPFTTALIEAAKAPGAPVETVFQNVRLAVHKATDGRQTPWEVTALTEPFQFFPGEDGKTEAPESEKSNDEWRTELRGFSAEKAYETVVVQNHVTVYQIFLSLYPDSEWSLIIRNLLERRIEMYAWFEAVTRNSAAAFEAFLKRYPKSDLARTARRLARQAELATASFRDWQNVLGDTDGAKTRTVYRDVVKEVRVPVVKVKEVVKEVRVPVVKEVVKEVRVPVVKEVVKEVRVPVVKIKEVVKEVRVPVVKEVVRTVRVPSPPKIKTVIKTVRVPSPPRIKTVVKTVRVPCRCSGGATTPNVRRRSNNFRLR